MKDGLLSSHEFPFLGGRRPASRISVVTEELSLVAERRAQKKPGFRARLSPIVLIVFEGASIRVRCLLEKRA